MFFLFLCRTEQTGRAELQRSQLLVLLAERRPAAEDRRVGLVQREELLPQALHGPRLHRDRPGVRVAQGQDGR